MLLVEEVCRVPRVQRHGLEAGPLPERGARPLPHSAHLGLSGEPIAIGRDGHGVPTLESNVGTVEVEEEGVVVAFSIAVPDPVYVWLRCRWGRLFNSVI